MGMGWLGWTEQQTLDTTMPAIELAHQGRFDMLKMCFGSGEDTATTTAGGQNEPPLAKQESVSIAKAQGVLRMLAG